MPKQTLNISNKGEPVLLAISICVGIIFTILVIILTYEIVSPLSDQINPLKVSLLFGFLFGLMSTGFVYFVGYLIYRRKKEYEGVMSELDLRLEHIIEYFAVANSSRKFQELLKLLRSGDLGKTKWLIAKFLSEKIRVDFDAQETKGKPDVVAISDFDSNDFATFAREITDECDTSILWTCPFRPERWFDTFTSRNEELSSTYNAWKKLNTRNPKDLAAKFNPERFPQLCGFLNSPLHNKLRIVNINSIEWNEMKKDGREIFEAFCLTNDSKRGHLWFLNTNELNGFNDEKNKDFALYDDKILLVHNTIDNVLYLHYTNVLRFRSFVNEASKQKLLKSPQQVKKELWP